MRSIFLALLVLLAAANGAGAGGTLGMAEPAVLEKYGRPVIVAVDPPAEMSLTFDKDGVYIIVQFMGGRVERLIYVRKDRNPFLRSEVDILLRNNTGLRWVARSPSEWTTVDEGFLAINDPDAAQISIASKTFVAAKKAIKERQLRGL